MSAACALQKRGKAVGLDSVATEALLYAGPRLRVHLCMLFNMFLRYGYLPQSFVDSVIVPLVKPGELTDINSYRTIEISTAVSKLFESVLVPYAKTTNHTAR